MLGSESSVISYIKRHAFSPVVPFILLHVACVLVLWSPPTLPLLGLFAASYALRIFAIGAGYHRYFAHRSFKTSRNAQFVLAFLAQTSAQKGVLWWAAHHRRHHRESDTEMDVHSPVRRGFFHSHVSWILSGEFDGYDPNMIRDFGRFPELRWLDRYHWFPTLVMAFAIVAVGGWHAFLWGYVLATVVVYHSTFSINSLCHLWGTRRFETGDHSRNNALLALLTFGEGWHNNHHENMHLCHQGLRWWEFDLTFLILRAFRKAGVIWDVKEAPPTAPARRVA
jgi:stearoyl-CoA desaturase (delta-9 desaturase)